MTFSYKHDLNVTQYAKPASSLFEPGTRLQGFLDRMQKVFYAAHKCMLFLYEAENLNVCMFDYHNVLYLSDIITLENPHVNTS